MGTSRVLHLAVQSSQLVAHTVDCASLLGSWSNLRTLSAVLPCVLALQPKALIPQVDWCH